MIYPVWFGTNRKPNARGDGFTGERHDRVSLGRVEVFVPEAHRFGEIGSSLMTRLKRFDLRDDRLRVQQVETREREAFFAEIQQEMQAARDGGDQPHALVFLHGFNVSFEEAAIRAAQIGFDLEVTGATAFFSWPSRGSVAAYPADEASIEASEEGHHAVPCGLHRALRGGEGAPDRPQHGQPRPAAVAPADRGGRQHAAR